MIPTLPPHLQRRTSAERYQITLGIILPAIIIVADITSFLVRGELRPAFPWLFALTSAYLITVSISACVGLWRGVTGRARIESADLDASKSQLEQAALGHPGQIAAGVALRPIFPAPLAGYLYTATSARVAFPLGSPSCEVLMRETRGWALSRSTAVDRAALLATQDPTRPMEQMTTATLLDTPVLGGLDTSALREAAKHALPHFN